MKFKSLQSRIIWLIFLTMTITAGAIIYFTFQDVGQAMYTSEESAARNVLRLIELNIRGEYEKLLADRMETMQQRKDRLKNQTAVGMSVIHEFAMLSQSGVVSLETAQNQLRDWIRRWPNPDVSLFLLNQEGTILAHPSDQVEGSSFKTVRDMKGRCLADVMCGQSLDAGGDYAVFDWKEPGASNTRGKTLGFFRPMPPWQWTLAAVVDIEDIEAEAQKKLNRIVDVLAKTFDEVQVAKSGGVFIFNGNRDRFILPSQLGALSSLVRDSNIKNSFTGEPLLSDIMTAVKNGKNLIRYAPATPAMEQMVMDAFIGYFRSLDWYIVVTVPVKEIQAPARFLVMQQSLIITLVFIGSLILAVFLVSRISKPLNMLTEHAKQLPLMDFSRISGDASPIDHLPKKYFDEVGRLAGSFIFMKTELQKNILSLMETTAAKERIEGELSVARDIQLGILPKIFPAFPDRKELALHALLEPAKEVGGDLYDFFFIDDDHLCIVVGDVSGKGVPAALFMTITMTLIKTIARNSLSPAEIMNRINDNLSVDNPKTMFVTLILGILDIRTGIMRYANAGHNPPVLVSRDGRVSFQQGISGPMAGVMEDISYRELSIQINPEEILFLYTDGVTEAMDTNNALFSDQKLLDCMESFSQHPVDMINHNLLETIRVHAGSAAQSDDITMVCMKYHGVG